MQEVHEEERGEDGGHFVSKMIKNHESIIRKKSAEVEELNLLKREIFRQKGNLSSRREEIGMQENSLKRRVQEIILKLDKLRDWDVKLNETFGNYEFDEEETLSEERFLKSDANHIDNLELDTLEDVWKKMDKVPYAVNEELQNEGSRLKQDQEEENLKAVIMERTYVTLLESLIKENHIELHDFEMVNQWKENIEGNNIESRTEKRYIAPSSARQSRIIAQINFALVECQDLRVENNSLEDSAFSDKFCYLEGTIREDVCWILLHEMLKEWNECIYGCETESLLREEGVSSDHRKFCEGGYLYGFHQRNDQGMEDGESQ
ncbi:WPP domain-associated protein [Prunus yedoensis var. nudiflora]|uniref:WPP domain-associated protein n=1 Tax=Prunus yedoensis var. nudiflora TaxID=2094558 RepID=A0A314V3K5_PRUYE|nr:WPP domain-associated protein [Prunus yedoensis var. nudiflora]